MIQFVYRNIAQVALVRPHPLADLNPLAQFNKRLELCISQLLDILRIMRYCTLWRVAEDLVLQLIIS